MYCFGMKLPVTAGQGQDNAEGNPIGRDALGRTRAGPHLVLAGPVTRALPFWVRPAFPLRPRGVPCEWARPTRPVHGPGPPTVCLRRLLGSDQRRGQAAPGPAFGEIVPGGAVQVPGRRTR